jgi:hypothetical protein
MLSIAVLKEIWLSRNVPPLFDDEKRRSLEVNSLWRKSGFEGVRLQPRRKRSKINGL